MRPALETTKKAVLAELPGFAAAIAAKLDVPTATVCRNLRKLELENLAYIDQYPEKGIRRGVHWAAGPKPADAPNPPEKTPRTARDAGLSKKPLPVSGSHVPFKSANTVLEDERIAQARAAGPATWITALGLPDAA